MNDVSIPMLQSYVLKFLTYLILDTERSPNALNVVISRGGIL